VLAGIFAVGALYAGIQIDEKAYAESASRYWPASENHIDQPISFQLSGI
jgi:hypothetical protein